MDFTKDVIKEIEEEMKEYGIFVKKAKIRRILANLSEARALTDKKEKRKIDKKGGERNEDTKRGIKGS